MIDKEIQKLVLNAINKAYSKSNISLGEVVIEKPKNLEHGDYATGVSFKLAGRVKQSPQEVAQNIIDYIKSSGFSFEQVGGFINAKIDSSYFYTQLEKILEEKEHYADGEKKDKKVQVEFISANPTGPLTIANGRGGFSGDALARVLGKSGFNVEREYYVNDGGNQVKILNSSIYYLVTKDMVANLEEPENFYLGKYVEDLAGEFKEKNNHVDDVRVVEAEIKKYHFEMKILSWIEQSTEKMNIKFDNWFSEKEMVGKGEVEESLKKIKEKGLTKEDSGALWFKTTEFGDDKDRVLVKADGEKTYFASDVAYHWDKFAVRKFDKVIDIWGPDHHGYIGRMMAATEAMGFRGKLEVIITQIVRLVKGGQEFKMSKRKGTYVTMDDLLETIGGTEREASDVARFFFLSRSFNSHMDFDLDLAKERSEKNPVFYVKYAYARISGILRNAKDLKLPKADLSKLSEREEMILIKTLLELPGLVSKIASSKGYPVHELTYYARDIASKFHSFYDKCRVIDEKDVDLTASRVELVRAVQIVLKIVMSDLIGIDTPEKM